MLIKTPLLSVYYPPATDWQMMNKHAAETAECFSQKFDKFARNYALLALAHNTPQMTFNHKR
jgi:hypothetical protein